MVLKAFVGVPERVNFQVMMLAFSNAPALVIDCAAFANPHRFSSLTCEFPVPLEKLHDVFVVEVELLYSLRDALKRAKDDLLWIDHVCRCRERSVDTSASCELKDRGADVLQRGASTIAVTAFSHLFNYQDENENREIYAHTWEVLHELGREFDVFVGIKQGSTQEVIARRYCDSLEMVLP